MDDIDELRSQIDETNLHILNLLTVRGHLIRQIGRIKVRREMELLDGKREKEILAKTSKANRGPYSYESIRSIFREIIRASRPIMDDIRKETKGT